MIPVPCRCPAHSGSACDSRGFSRATQVAVGPRRACPNQPGPGAGQSVEGQKWFRPEPLSPAIDAADTAKSPTNLHEPMPDRGGTDFAPPIDMRIAHLLTRAAIANPSSASSRLEARRLRLRARGSDRVMRRSRRMERILRDQWTINGGISWVWYTTVMLAGASAGTLASLAYSLAG